MKKLLVLALALVIGGGLAVVSYGQDGGQKAREMVAALDKNKYKKKEKKGITVEVYVDVKNVAVVKKDAAEYSGVYGDENSNTRLMLKAAHDGSVEGGGYDDGDAGKLRFTLKNARIDSGVLTATKAYENGETKKIEAVFVNRTVSSGTNAASITTQETAYGIGYIESYGPDSQSRYFLGFRK